MPENEPNSPVTYSPRWNLDDLYLGPRDPQLEHDKADLLRRAQRLAEHGRDLRDLEPTRLREFLDEREQLEAMRMRVNAFCVLSWTVNTQDPEIGRLESENEAFQADVLQLLSPFDQEIAASPLESQLTDVALLKYRRYLQRTADARAYRLSEGEEALFGKLSLSGGAGWQRFFQEHQERWRYNLDGATLSSQEILEALDAPDRPTRAKASQAVHATLTENAHTTTFVYNMLLLDKMTKDAARGYDTWLSERTLKNESEEEEVAALIEAVTGRYDLVRRYFRLYREVLGYETLSSYDLYLELPLLDQPLSWDKAKTTVLAALSAFSPELSRIATQFFEKGWIDAAPADGKLGGAFCSSGTSTVHPYIFLNFTGKAGDLFTLAHEMGHGLHGYLARERGQLQYEAGDTLQELAAMFCEMLIFTHLLENESDPQRRFALQMQKVQHVMNSMFQQVSFHVFEAHIHEARRERGELSTKDISDFWIAARGAMYGDSVALDESYALSWGLVPHFLEVPGYVHTYAYAELLAWTLFAVYQREPQGFAEQLSRASESGGVRVTSGATHSVRSRFVRRKYLGRRTWPNRGIFERRRAGKKNRALLSALILSGYRRMRYSSRRCGGLVNPPREPTLKQGKALEEVFPWRPTIS